MKPLFISFISFLLLILTWFFFVGHMEKSLFYLSSTLEVHVYEEIEAENWEEGTKHFMNLSMAWDNQKCLYNMFSDHQAITTIDLSLARISEYLHHQEKNLALAEIAVVQQLFAHLHTGELFSIDNIL